MERGDRVFETAQRETKRLVMNLSRGTRPRYTKATGVLAAEDREAKATAIRKEASILFLVLAFAS